MMEKMKRIVSACLCGLRTRYNGDSSEDPEVLQHLKRGDAIPLCPEQLGGLPTPREPVEFRGGDGQAVLRGKARVLGFQTGEDLTDNLLRGARELLEMAKRLGVRSAILKEGSPSCGLHWVKVDGRWKNGMGVTAALLREAGIELECRGLPESLKNRQCSHGGAKDPESFLRY